MPVRIVIAPRRSLGLYAVLSILMVCVSYLLIMAVAFLCVYLPYRGLLAMTNLQLLLLLVGGVVVAGTLLWSLVPRRHKFEAPGPLLQRSAHPKLFGMVDEVAAALNEPLPQEVYLIADPNAFVANRGGFLSFGSKRILAIGLPLLWTLNVSEFRAVLAHEFGHYYGGDTKMASWVFRAQKAMVSVFQNLGAVGWIARVGIVRLLYYLVATFVGWYFTAFLKVVKFISRKQEFRSDELACIVAGTQPMMSGLRKIHGAFVAWPLYWSSEVSPILGLGFLPTIGDGFSRFLAAPQISAQVESAIKEELAEGKTSAFDSHPPLAERLAAMDKLQISQRETEVLGAWTLVEKPEELEMQFLQHHNPQMQPNSLQRVGWEEAAQKVLVPLWRKSAQDYFMLLEGINVVSLPEKLKQLPQLGTKMRNPKGRLFSREQGEAQATKLLATALGVALVDNGWNLSAEPGRFRIYRGADEMDVFQAVQDCVTGKMSAEAWTNRCKELGIAELSLVPATDPVERASSLTS